MVNAVEMAEGQFLFRHGRVVLHGEAVRFLKYSLESSLDEHKWHGAGLGPLPERYELILET
ncbi:MAG TPA: hypothetical protein VJ866_22390 [Pyrinomonadaceae bacterium]|nr:hypothetical protein [Pyrinomonadaceae bacterium]